MRLSAIAAVQQKDYGIGNAGELLFRLPADMKRVKKYTHHKPLIMGRRTWESIPERFRPLPNRINIVVTSRSDYEVTPPALVVHSLDRAIDLARATGADEAFIFGGHTLYQEALPQTQRLYITYVNGKKEADTFFPAHDAFSTVITHETVTDNGYATDFYILER